MCAVESESGAGILSKCYKCTTLYSLEMLLGKLELNSSPHQLLHAFFGSCIVKQHVLVCVCVCDCVRF